MIINFNTPIDRRCSESEKWSTYSPDTIPMWVADSDYAIPDQIIQALKKRLEHPILGYGEESGKLRQLIVSRMKRLYSWNIKPQWVCFTPGVVPSLNSCRAIMGPIGSKAITALPVYPHLQNPTPILERPMQFFTMKEKNGRYTPDFEELEKKITPETKMLILCNPHNPVGTVYQDDELTEFAKIAQRHKLIICSDDIHADFPLYKEKPYRPIATLSPEISQKTITLMAASKTFNIAGLNCSYAIIEDKELRKKFTTQLKGLVGGVNVLGFIASEAAYEYGDSWLKQQIEHLRHNAEYCYKRINAMPYVRMKKMEATYLAWIEARELHAKLQKQGEKSAYDYFLKRGVAVSDGNAFGDNEFFRINLATTHTTLEKGLEQIEKAIHELLPSDASTSR